MALKVVTPYSISNLIGQTTDKQLTLSQEGQLVHTHTHTLDLTNNNAKLNLADGCLNSGHSFDSTSLHIHALLQRNPSLVDTFWDSKQRLHFRS